MSTDDTTSGQPRPAGSASYGAKDIQVLEGLDPVRKRPGHVHRLDRSGRPPPPHLGGRRQLRRRGDGRLLHAHRRHAARRRRLPRRRQRSRHPGRPVPVRPAQGQERGRGRAHRAPRRRQVRRRRATRCRAACTASASASSTRCPSGCSSRSTATASATARSTPRAASRRARWRSSARRRARGRKTGTTVTFWPDPTVFVAEGTEFVARTVLERLQTMAFLNRGLEIVFDDERPEKEQKVTYQYKGGLVDFVKHLNASKEALFPKVCHYEDEDEDHQTLDIAIQWNTGYYEGIHGYANGISTTEGGMHVEGFRTRADDGRQQVRPGQGPAQGEGREPPRRGHPRGHHGDRLGEAARPAVRGPDEGQARQRPDALVRPEGHQRAPRRVARREPDRGQQGRQEGAGRGPGARGGEERPQRHPPQDGAVRRRHAGQAEGLLQPQRRRERAVHRRGRLGRRHRARRPRSADPGDPADPRQDPQRRAGARRQDAEEQRDPDADHGHRRRRRRGVRRHQGPLPQGHRAGRRRRRRQPHPHAAADVLLPPDAPAGRGRLRVHRPAAAVLHRGRQGEGVPQGRRRQGPVPRGAPEPQEGLPAPEGPRRDGLGGAARDDDVDRRRARCCRSPSRRPRWPTRS